MQLPNHLETYIKAIGYNITDGTEFLWSCYGSNARYLDCDTEDFHVSAVFDTATQEVYEASISSNYNGDIAYKWHNQLYIEQYKTEAKARNVIWDECSEDLMWAITDTYEDILDKIEKILSGKEYDTRVVMVLDLDTDLISQLQDHAKQRNITVEEFVEYLLTNLVNESENETP